MTDKRARSKPLAIDAEPGNADWIKSRHWDFYDAEGQVNTLVRLRRVLPNMSDAQLVAWLDLLSGKAMPEQLRREIEALLT